MGYYLYLAYQFFAMNSQPNELAILIVDDEKKACLNLQNMLLEYVDANINIVGMANCTLTAESLITQHKPDVVFLDVEMPNENAFQFLKRISPLSFEVIFVTAYDEYAVRAFKLNAVDYILKPISIPELKNAVTKLNERLKLRKMLFDTQPDLSALSGQINSKVNQSKIILKGANTIEIVEFKDICFVEAQSSYSRIVFIKQGDFKELVMSNPLSEYEELLPSELFFRIHRSYLVNCLHLKKLANSETNYVDLNGDFKLPVSRRKFSALIEFLKGNAYLQ